MEQRVYLFLYVDAVYYEHNDARVHGWNHDHGYYQACNVVSSSAVYLDNRFLILNVVFVRGILLNDKNYHHSSFLATLASCVRSLHCGAYDCGEDAAAADVVVVADGDGWLGHSESRNCVAHC